MNVPIGEESPYCPVSVPGKILSNVIHGRISDKPDSGKTEGAQITYLC